MNHKLNKTTMSGREGLSCENFFFSLEEIGSIQSVEFESLGQHLIVDFYNCKSIPSTAESLEQVMLATAREIKSTVVTSSFHEFSPHGLSGVVVIAESHLAAHTWPEHGTVCVDLFTCSSEMESTAGLAFLFESLGAQKMTLASCPRGNIMTEFTAKE